MTACPLCATNSGIHDFQQTCCRVRYLLALPGLDARRCIAGLLAPRARRGSR